MVPVIGSLRNHEEDDSHNVKKKNNNWVNEKKQQLCTRITLLKYISLASRLHDYDVKPPNATFYIGREQRTTNFPVSF